VELSANFTVGGACLSQLECARAPLSYRLDLSTSTSTGWALRVYGVAPWSAAIGPMGKSDLGNQPS
jgi:hypothetical protein